MSPHTKVDDIMKQDYLMYNNFCFSSSAFLRDGRLCGQVSLRPQAAGDDKRDPGLGRGVQVPLILQ